MQTENRWEPKSCPGQSSPAERMADSHHSGRRSHFCQPPLGQPPAPYFTASHFQGVPRMTSLPVSKGSELKRQRGAPNSLTWGGSPQGYLILKHIPLESRERELKIDSPKRRRYKEGRRRGGEEERRGERRQGEKQKARRAVEKSRQSQQACPVMGLPG